MVSTRVLCGLLGMAALGLGGCNSSPHGVAGAGADAGGDTAGSGGTGTPAGGTSGSGGAGPAAGGAGGSGTGGAGSQGAGADSGAGQGGAGGAAGCVPGVESTIITDCGYPSASSSPLSSVVFNESDVLRAIQPSGGAPSATVRVFYNDEHALTLGVRQVVVKTASGVMTTDYPVSPLAASPSSAASPSCGSNELVGPQSGLDVSQRPMWPSLFITDITSDPGNRAGDWQMGGRPLGPGAIHGVWKAAVRTVDTTVTPNTVTITPDRDPAKNNWTLGGGDPVPAGLPSEGYGAEVVWTVPLTPGHSYRLQTIVHDGDQNKAGGDSGEACVLFCAGGTAGPGEGADAGAPPPSCPTGRPACGEDGIAPGQCPEMTVCANGCCVPLIL